MSTSTTTHRGTSNSNARGSARSRRERKAWLLTTFGDGTTAPCSFGCGTMLTVDTITVDRFPLAGVDGGRYVRGNIRPACGPCNSLDGHVKGQQRQNVRGYVTWRGHGRIAYRRPDGVVFRVEGDEQIRCGRVTAATFTPARTSMRRAAMSA